MLSALAISFLRAVAVLAIFVRNEIAIVIHDGAQCLVHVITLKGYLISNAQLASM